VEEESDITAKNIFVMREKKPRPSSEVINELNEVNEKKKGAIGGWAIRNKSGTTTTTENSRGLFQGVRKSGEKNQLGGGKRSKKILKRQAICSSRTSKQGKWRKGQTNTQERKIIMRGKVYMSQIKVKIKHCICDCSGEKGKTQNRKRADSETACWGGRGKNSKTPSVSSSMSNKGGSPGPLGSKKEPTRSGYVP